MQNLDICSTLKAFQQGGGIYRTILAVTFDLGREGEKEHGETERQTDITLVGIFCLIQIMPFSKFQTAILL